MLEDIIKRTMVYIGAVVCLSACSQSDIEPKSKISGYYAFESTSSRSYFVRETTSSDEVTEVESCYMRFDLQQDTLLNTQNEFSYLLLTSKKDSMNMEWEADSIGHVELNEYGVVENLGNRAYLQLGKTVYLNNEWDLNAFNTDNEYHVNMTQVGGAWTLNDSTSFEDVLLVNDVTVGTSNIISYKRVYAYGIGMVFERIETTDGSQTVDAIRKVKEFFLIAHE